MDLNGEYRIKAPRKVVWELINDPEVLKACIPGCESLRGQADGGFEAKVTTKIGPIKASFEGAVQLSNIQPPESYTISGEGKGGVAGFAKGGADVRLAEDGNETILTYVAKAQVGGKLAQLGARLIDSTAKKLADEFFRSLAAHISGPTASMDIEPASDREPAAVKAVAPSIAPAASLPPGHASALASATAKPWTLLVATIAVLAVAAILLRLP